VDFSNCEATSAESAVCDRSNVSDAASDLSSTLKLNPEFLGTGDEAIEMGVWLRTEGGTQILVSSDSDLVADSCGDASWGLSGIMGTEGRTISMRIRRGGTLV
jgi:hypothetical protein